MIIYQLAYEYFNIYLNIAWYADAHQLITSRGYSSFLSTEPVVRENTS